MQREHHRRPGGSPLILGGDRAASLDRPLTAVNQGGVVDLALVVLLICAASGPAMLNSALSRTDHLSWRSAFPLTVIGVLALLWRRCHPRAVVVVTTVCSGVAAAFGYLLTLVLLAPVMVALFELARRASARTTLRCHAAVTVSVVVAALVGRRSDFPWLLTVLDPVVFLLLPVVLAEVVRLRQDHLAAVLARADRAERTREEEACRRVAQERLRIAHELHDVVAHHLALANVQAGTAAHHPDRAQPLLAELAGTMSAALREVKATVGLLREPTGPGSAGEPGLAQLAELTTAFASAGLRVEVVVEGEWRRLPPDLDLTAFRIVQEALTNVTKHAATSTASVRLVYTEQWLTLSVTNPAGRVRPAGPGAGFGVVGMRERAQAVGGRLRAGPTPGGGFLVTADLPLRFDFESPSGT